MCGDNSSATMVDTSDSDNIREILRLLDNHCKFTTQQKKKKKIFFSVPYIEGDFEIVCIERKFLAAD